MISACKVTALAQIGAALAVFLFTCIHPAALSAAPAHPGAFETAQPNGKKVKIHLRGDEHFSWHEDEKGYAVKQDEKDHYWKYARPKEDKGDFDVIDGAEVGSADPVKLKLKKRDLPKKELLREQFDKNQQLDMSTETQESQAADDEAESQIEPPTFEIPVSGTKTIKNIVILASFKDHWDAVAGTVLSSKGRVNTAEYSNLFNQIGHVTDGAVGSVKDYYREVSYGKLTVDSIVTPWVMLPENEAYYGALSGTKKDANRPQLAADAVAAAEAAGFNFAQGDSDGDGWADGLTIIHSGHGQEISGNPSDCIWSHKGSMSTIVTVDGVKMQQYHTEPALRGATSSTSIIRIGVIAHEMGHFFGLPDLYDYSSQTHGLGNWCMMAGGSWNGSYGNSPAHFSAWAKAMLGFLAPEPQYAASGKSLPRVEDNPVVHLYRDGMSNDEYFLVENRAKYGFDNTAEIYPGILVYHVDAKSSNNDLNTWPHPAVKIEEADGNDSLGLKSFSSQAGDAWTSANSLVGGFRDATGVQSANAMKYQSIHAYNRSNSSSSYSYIRLKDFSAAGNVMTYTAETLRPQVADVSSSTGSYSVTWGAASNASQYEIQEGSETTLTSFADGAESESVMFDSWAAQGDARRSSGGARTGTWSYVFQYYDSAASKGYSSVQALTLRNPFTVKSSTSLSFYFKSKLSADSGYFKYQVSKDGGVTWLTLGTQGGYQDAWTQVVITYSSLVSLGISENDQLLFRFISNFEQISGWSSWPSYGYAVDDFQISGTEIKGYGNWATLSSSVGSTSYAVSGKSSGKYVYRVRVYANGLWQNYGSVGVATVSTSSYQLTVSKSGAGFGTVTSVPSGISCGSACSASYPSGQSVTLTASADSGSTFAGWSGACTGTGACTVSMTAARSVTATFNAAYTLTVSKSGTGSGTVTSSPSGISCGSACSASYPSGQSVTLTASADSGSTFAGWSGACTGTGACTVSMTAARSVTATFNAAYTLTVSKSGTGSGTVTSSPSGISCGSACSASYPSGQSVTLTASADSGSTFAGWSGACTGTGACTVSMTAARSVTAMFNAAPTVQVLANGVPVTGLSGDATSFRYFSITVPLGASNLTIATDGGGGDVDLYTRFGQLPALTEGEWECRPYMGGNIESCSFPAPQAGVYYIMLYGYNAYSGVTLTASYTQSSASHTLIVSKSGAGSGTVTSSPSGISCGSACSASYPSGQSVTLTASADSGSEFAGWSGACSGMASTCAVSMTEARAVTAAFNQQAPDSLSTCLDNNALAWTSGGNAVWFCQSSVSVVGGSAAQSGIIGNNEESWLATTVTGPGTLSFYWRVSSEEGYDLLTFSLDEDELAEISGDAGWTRKTFFIPEGTHDLVWKYHKDGSEASGSDAGWIDKVEYKLKTGGGNEEANAWLPAVKMLLKR